MMNSKIIATFAFTALLAMMAPAAHAQARRGGGGTPVGHAVPRTGPAHPGGPGAGPSHPIYGGPGYGYGRYYYPSPYYRYPYYPYYGYGYGGFGFSFGFGVGVGLGVGYGYPYYASAYPYYYPYPYPPYPYPPYPYAAPGGYPVAAGGYPAAPTYGGIRLDLPQKDAMVYEDGYLAGRVGDFDGSRERLALPGGSHRIEIRADAFAPLTFDVNIEPGRTIVYSADLRQPQQPPAPAPR